MSTKAKTKAAPKRTRTVPARWKSAVPAHGAASQSRSGRWTMRINPNSVAFIAQTMRPCHLVIQNRGPGRIYLSAQNGDLIELASGQLRATYVHGSVSAKVLGDKPALIELEFFPVLLRN